MMVRGMLVDGWWSPSITVCTVHLSCLNGSCRVEGCLLVAVWLHALASGNQTKRSIPYHKEPKEASMQR